MKQRLFISIFLVAIAVFLMSVAVFTVLLSIHMNEVNRQNLHNEAALAAVAAEHGGVAAGKAMMLAHGVDCGDPRPPLDRLDDATKRRIVEEFRRIVAR